MISRRQADRAAGQRHPSVHQLAGGDPLGKLFK
jgi:hypothetical protein